MLPVLLVLGVRLGLKKLILHRIGIMLQLLLLLPVASYNPAKIDENVRCYSCGRYCCCCCC